jgi:GAF domain-containing protein
MLLAEILKPLVNTLDVTSAWVCRYENRTTTVIGEYIAETANLLEKDGDLFAVHEEADYSSLGAWLRSADHPPRLIHVDALPANDPEYRELSVNGVRTVLNVPIHIEGNFWGYVEVWETRQKRQYTTADIQYVMSAPEQMAELIAAAD